MHSDNLKRLIIGLSTLLLVFAIGLTVFSSLFLPRTSVVPVNPRTPVLTTTETVETTRTLSINLTEGHTYLWNIRVSQGSLKATLADDTAIFWTVTRDPTGSIVYSTTVNPPLQWVAPRTTTYSLILENQDPTSTASCRVEVWELNLSVRTP